MADIDLQIMASGAEASNPPGPSVEISKQVEYGYQVSNPGTVPLEAVDLVDDRGTPDPNDDIRPTPELAPAPDTGTLEHTFSDWDVGGLLRHPTEPLIYASIRNLNSVAVINTNTLAIEETIFTGSQPWRMALTPDGNTLYVVNGYTQLVSVVDTQTNTKVEDLVLPDYAIDIAVAADGQLLVLNPDWIKKFNPATGEIGPELIGRSYADPGELLLNEAKDRLFFAKASGSPQVLYQFDLTVDPPQLLFNSIHLEVGEAGDFALTSDSEHLVVVDGVPGNSAIYRTSDMAIVGTLNSGARGEVAIAPDDSVVYGGQEYYEIGIYDLETYLPIETFFTGVRTRPSELLVDHSGAHLFAAIDEELRVFATGRGPEINVGDTNADGWLDPGEQWQFTASVAAEAGSQSTGASVSAVSAASEVVDDSATVYYNGAFGLQLTATVAGAEDPQVASASDVEFRYELTNTGQLPIGDIELVDDNGTAMLPDDFAPEFVSGDTNSNDRLDPSETWTFRAVRSVRAGDYQGAVEVTGIPYDGDPIDGAEASATTELNYYGTIKSVNIELRTNGQTADLPAGVRVEVGDPIEWTYEVTNNGNVPLANVQVSDTGGTTSPADDFAPDAIMGAGIRGALLNTFPELTANNFLPHPTEPLVYIPIENQNRLAVIHTETLELLDSILVGSSPRSMVFSADASTLYVSNFVTNVITVVDTATHTVTGQLFAPAFVRSIALAADGQLYAMTKDWLGKIDPATGNVGPSLVARTMLPTLSGIMIVDGDNDRMYLAPLAGSDTQVHQFDTSDPSQLVLLNETPSTGDSGRDFVLSHDGDLAAYSRGSPNHVSLYLASHMIEIGVLDTDSSARSIAFSNDDQFVYTVHTRDEIDVFSAQTYLQQSTIPIDGNALDLWVAPSDKYLFASFDDEIRVYHTGRFAPDFNEGDTNFNHLLDPGETWLYSSTGVAAAGLQGTEAVVSAETLDGTFLTDDDPSYYIGGLAIAVDATLNEIDTASDLVPLLDARVDALWSFEVSNPGQVPLANVSVTDEHVSAGPGDDIFGIYVNGDTNGNDLLDPGETWLFEADAPPIPGQHITQAIAVATPVNQANQPIVSERIEASDANHYLARNPILEVELLVEGDPVDEPTGPELPIGEEIRWEYQLHNAGDLPLDDVSLIDTNGTADPSDDFAPTALLNPLGTLGALQGEVPTTGSQHYIWDLVEHPTRPYLYAITTNARFYVINTDTFEIEHSVSLTDHVRGLDLDVAAEKLYIAVNDTTDLYVWDTENNQALAPLELPSAPLDIATGPSGELFTIFPGQIVELDPSTGEIVGDPLAGADIVYGNTGLTSSPSKDRLYFANYFNAPARLYQFDLTADPPERIHSREETGFGYDLSISDSGSLISYPTNANEHDSETAILDGDTLEVIGYLATGEPAGEVAFSPDESRAYTVHGSGTIQVWDLATFELLGEVSTQGGSAGLWVSDDNLRLISSFAGRLRSYSTGNDGIAIQAGDDNLNGWLDPGETWSYESTSIVQAGQFATTAHATATPLLADGTELPDFADEAESDAGHYFGVLPAAAVVKRQLFYNQSMLDGNDPAINAADDDAIAGLEPLLPGEIPNLNQTSAFVLGINGIMIDVDHLASDTLDPATDFEFRTGSGGDPTTWPLAPQPNNIAVRTGAGTDGSDRIVLTWDAGAITDSWLQVVVKATDETGLEADDTFYFAHLTGDITGDGIVNASDFQSARANPKNFLSPAAADDPHDINRDARVNAADLALIRDRSTSLSKALGKLSHSSVQTKTVPIEAKSVIPVEPAGDTSTSAPTSAEELSSEGEPTELSEENYVGLLTEISVSIRSPVTDTTGVTPDSEADEFETELLDALFQRT